MKYEIKNRWSGAVMFTAELEAHFETESERVKLGAAIKLAVQARAYLGGANLADAYLAGAYLGGANLADANFAGAYLVGANLADAYLAGAYLGGANLADANLAGANLGGANFADAYFGGANLADANLADAYLGGANLAGAYLADANLADAYLAGAKWRNGIVLTKAPLQIFGLTWPVYVLENHMQIGCELHTHEKWTAFTDRQIAAMDGTSAARFWKQNREWLLAACASHAVKADEAKAA